MTITVIDGADATTGNVAKLPPGLGIVAGYATGPGIAWTAAQLAAYPGAIIIDQDPHAIDPMADVLDFEAGAATEADLAPWAQAAQADYHSAARPGQRSPAIYASQSSLTAACNALSAAGVTGVGLWVANWTEGRGAAVTQLQQAGGPYPIIGVQWADAGDYDLDVFSAAWVNARSARPAVQPPPGQWHDPQAWTWAEACIIGIGTDGKLHSFEYRPGAPWARLA
jgi:hypothetical protein